MASTARAGIRDFPRSKEEIDDVLKGLSFFQRIRLRLGGQVFVGKLTRGDWPTKGLDCAIFRCSCGKISVNYLPTKGKPSCVFCGQKQK